MQIKFPWKTFPDTKRNVLKKLNNTLLNMDWCIVPWHAKSSGEGKKFGFKSDEADDPGIVLVLLGNTIVFRLGGLFIPDTPTPKDGLHEDKNNQLSLTLHL